MKAKNRWSLLAVSAAALSLNLSTSSGQVFDAVEVLSNRAVAASPRAKEAFPWLTRSAATTVTPAKALDSGTTVTGATENRAIASSPRTREEFPELARPAQTLRKASDTAFASTVIKNRAWASSPRAREENPWLTRGNYTVSETPFQIAPLK